MDREKDRQGKNWTEEERETDREHETNRERERIKEKTFSYVGHTYISISY